MGILKLLEITLGEASVRQFLFYVFLFICKHNLIVTVHLCRHFVLLFIITYFFHFLYLFEIQMFSIQLNYNNE